MWTGGEEIEERGSKKFQILDNSKNQKGDEAEREEDSRWNERVKRGR